jgi:hypothetical protein
MNKLFFITALLLSTSTFAKDMTSRLGVGYSDQFSTSMPSVAVKYYSSQDFALSAALGIDTNTTNSAAGGSNFGFGARIYKTIFPEDNLNFYMGAGVGLLTIGSTTVGGTSTSGFELSGFAGCELFFPGLDSVGINFQAGIGVTSLSSGVRFRTIGDSPLRAGMFFYF